MPGGHLWRFYDYHALCNDCGWESWTTNAQGNAAQHSRRYNHTVVVDVNGSVTYASDEQDNELRAMRGKPPRT